jgi:hypothetical protein
MTETTVPNLASRLLAVMGEVPYIQKGGKTQSGPSFKYVRHDDVVALVRPALVKHGVAFLATVRPESLGCVEVAPTKSGTARYKTTLMVDMTFVNVDDPADAYSVSFPGEGIDTEDKASGKALSYALKNGLLKTFMIEAGDEADNEATSPESAPASHPQPAATPRQSPVQPPAAEPSGNGHLTRTEAQVLHDMLVSKGYDDVWFLERLKAKGVGDGALWSSVPGEFFTELRDVIITITDKAAEAQEPAGGQEPAEAGARAAREPPAPVATEAQQQAAQRAAARPDGCTLDTSYMQCAYLKRGEEPVCGGCEHFDAAWKPLDAATRTDQGAERPPWGTVSKVGTVTAAQLTRLGSECKRLENAGVAEHEWRELMWKDEQVTSRRELSKAAWTRVMESVMRWATDIESGVVAAGAS